MATTAATQEVQALQQNGDPPSSTTTEPKTSSEANKKPAPRFLGPPIKIGDPSNGQPSEFLPLGAGGPAPPVFEQETGEQAENGKEPPTPHVRFLGPPIKIGDVDQSIEEISPMIFEMRAVQHENGEITAVCGAVPRPPIMVCEMKAVTQENGEVMAECGGPMPQSRIPVNFLPLGAGGPPPENLEKVEDSPSPREKFFGQPATFETKTEEGDNLVGKIPRCPPYENGKAVMEPVGPPGPAPPVVPEEGFDEGDLPTKKTELQEEVTRKLTPRCLGPPLKFEDFERAKKDDESKTPPNTPQGEIPPPFEGSPKRDPSRIPLGAGGPAPSTLHPLSKNGIPAQSPPRFPIGPDGGPIGLEQDPQRYPLNTIGPEGLAYPEMRSNETSECNLATNGILESPLAAPPKEPEPRVFGLPPPDPDPSSGDKAVATPLSGVKTPQEFGLPPPESDAPPKDPKPSDVTPPTPSTPPPTLAKPANKNVIPPPTLAKPKVVSTLPRKTSVPLRAESRGAIANLGSSISSGGSPVNPLSVAAPRRSHSFIGFSSPSLAQSVAESVHAHRQTFLARRALFDQPDGAAFASRKPAAMRRFEIELKALKLGGKSLGDSWVTEEVETREARDSPRDPGRTRPASLQPSHLRRTADAPLVAESDTKAEAPLVAESDTKPEVPTTEPPSDDVTE